MHGAKALCVGAAGSTAAETIETPGRRDGVTWVVQPSEASAGTRRSATRDDRQALTLSLRAACTTRTRRGAELSGRLDAGTTGHVLRGGPGHDADRLDARCGHRDACCGTGWGPTRGTSCTSTPSLSVGCLIRSGSGSSAGRSAVRVRGARNPGGGPLRCPTSLWSGQGQSPEPVALSTPSGRIRIAPRAPGSRYHVTPRSPYCPRSSRRVSVCRETPSRVASSWTPILPSS